MATTFLVLVPVALQSPAILPYDLAIRRCIRRMRIGLVDASRKSSGHWTVPTTFDHVWTEVRSTFARFKSGRSGGAVFQTLLLYHLSAFLTGWIS